MIDPADVPYGTEVFVIVPDEHVTAVRDAKSRLISALASEFPGFTFSLGVGVSDHVTDFEVMTVAGVVGDGWQKARPVRTLGGVDQIAITEYLRRFVAGDVAKAN